MATAMSLVRPKVAHVAEDVRGVESLAGDVEFEVFGEFGGDFVEDDRGEFIVSKESLIAFEGAGGESRAWFGVEGILDVGAKDVGFDGLVGVPAVEVGEEDESRHGIEFFGGRACGVAEVFGEVSDGHEFEEDLSEDALPAGFDDFPTGGWDDAVEGVEESVLSRVDEVDHGGRNSLDYRRLSISCPAVESRGK